MQFQFLNVRFQAKWLFLFFLFQAFHFSISAFSQPPYFQQTVNYTIQVSLNDSSNELHAFETIEYYNNSSFELREIYFHLWPNAYKNDNTALAKQQLENGNTEFYYSKEEERGYIDQLDFKVNGQNVNWKLDSIHIDICILQLADPIGPGGHISITTPFHVKIPKTFSRLGHVGQSYQITQWYPKPAVFDRYGWHAMPYLDQGEFYSEYGTFDVFITLPKNYVVGATGDLVNAEVELQWLDSIVKITESIESYNSKDLVFPASSKESKTLHYHQENVHDFAWFADKRFHVLKGEIELPHTKRKVTTWAMFTNVEAYVWKNAISYINDAVYYYSLWNGDYPYNQVTALESKLSAGGGMEYPNVTVIGSAGSPFGLETVIMHEVGHNWFYGILGSNERDHAWMDEGINSYNESRYVSTKYPNASIMGIENKLLLNTFKLKNFKHKALYYNAYLFSAKQHIDQPIGISSPKFLDINYAAIVYCKTAVAFDYLRAYLSTSEMDKSMQKYFDSWKFKHPYPDDIKKVFESTTSKKLDWFFSDLIKTNKKLDYKIVSKKIEGDSIIITIKNTGDLQSPVVIGALENGTPSQLEWKEGFKGKQTISFPTYETSISGVSAVKHRYSSFKIDPFEVMPEMNRNNNTLRTHGLFKKVEPLQFQFIGTLNDPNKTQLFYAPVVGWNYHNGFMPGIAVYNHFIFSKPFEFMIMPLYSTKTNNLAGSMRFAKNFFFNHSFIHSLQIAYHFKRYAFDNDDAVDYYYEKNDLSAIFTFRKGNPRSKVENTLTLRNIALLYDPAIQPIAYQVNDIYSIVYQLANKRKINPYTLIIGIEPTSKYVKSSIEGLYKITFKGKNKGVDLRFFAGKFLSQSSSFYGNYNFRMSGWNGYQDYLYDYIFLGRYVDKESTLAQRFVERDGAFKVYSAVGASNDWLTALNIKLFPPFKLPIGLFADFGFSSTSEKLMYDVGIQLSVIRNLLDIYFPLNMSKEMQDALDINGYTYLQTIRFTLNLSGFNLTEMAINSAR